MIQLTDDTLTFSFPHLANRLRELLDEHLQKILPELLRPEERDALIDELESRWGFEQLSRIEQDKLRARARALTAAEIEAAVRQRAAHRIDPHDDSFTDLSIEFQRTLRIPDDDRTYPLPAGLGSFPLRSVDDHAGTVPEEWLRRGGVLMPMHQSEALWLWFSSSYSFAVKIGAGKIDAVSGEPWSNDLQREPQNYVVAPTQPWLDGFSVGEGLIRQFVAMPLGDGYSVEEQLTGKADVGGMQLEVFPLSPDAYFRDEVISALPSALRELCDHLFPLIVRESLFSRRDYSPSSFFCEEGSMGLGAGGKMRQEIYRDPYDFAAWDQTQSTRCFVHFCNSLVWRQITGENPPHPPLTAKEYKEGGIPWFDYYRNDLQPLKGSKQLAGVKSVAQLGKEKKSQPLPENMSIAPDLIVQYGNTRRPGEIREFLDAP